MDENGNNPTYPEATFEWNEEEGGIRKVWVTWPDGRKESVNSLYSDDDVTNGIDRFYVILANDIEQTVIVKDKDYLELREKGKKIWKEFEKEFEKEKEKRLKMYRKKMSRKKIIVGTSLLVLLSIPFVFIYFSNSRKRDI
jgi:hypothetical protein